MYYYVLSEQNTIVNSIVLDGETDPALFGAVADERVFAIGDTWVAPVSELEQLRADMDFLAAMTGISLWEDNMTNTNKFQRGGGAQTPSPA